MTRALLIVDVQNDFSEGGALGVSGGNAVAAGVAALMRSPDRYELVVGSRDWHLPEGNNGGHFVTSGNTPNYSTTWPIHCVQGSPGAEYHPALPASRIDVHVVKGMGIPAYSAFEGETSDGQSLAAVLKEREVDRIDIVGLATDFCVLQSGLDALRTGLQVRIFTDLVAGVHAEGSAAALAQLADAGAELVVTTES